MGGVPRPLCPPGSACHLSGSGSLLLELSHDCGWAAPSSMLPPLLLTWTALSGRHLLPADGFPELQCCRKGLRRAGWQRLDFRSLWIPCLMNAARLSPPRTNMGEAHCTCATGHCGLCKELHCVLDPQRSLIAFSWEDPGDQVLVGKPAASSSDQATPNQSLDLRASARDTWVLSGCFSCPLGLLHGLPGCMILYQ